jgi:hypothetical protein
VNVFGSSYCSEKVCQLFSALPTLFGFAAQPEYGKLAEPMKSESTSSPPSLKRLGCLGGLMLRKLVVR